MRYIPRRNHTNPWKAYFGLILLLAVLSISTSSTTASAPDSSTLLNGIEIQRKIDIPLDSPNHRMRQEFTNAKEKLESTKSSVQGEEDIDALVESLTRYVGALSHAISLESSGLSMEERQLVASAHFDVSLLHLSSILPIFTPEVAKTSLFYTPEGYGGQDIFKWKQDWLVKLAMAVEEDSAAALQFDNPAHYVLHDIFPLNLRGALYHLNKASILGHNSARALFSVLSKIGSRSLSPSQILPTPFTEAHNNHAPSTSLPRSKEGENKVESDKHETPVPSSATASTSSETNKLAGKVVRAADWKMLEHIFQDLSAGGKSPSALLSEGYHQLHGIGTYGQQCTMAKKSLREATQPLLELLKHRIPSPALEFDEHAVPPQKLMEEYSHQSMGTHKQASEYERMDLIDYYTYQAREPGQHQAKSVIGAIHLYGSYGYPRNYERAKDYFTEADRSFPSSQLAYMHHLGLSVPKDVNKAMQLYHRAAARNDSFALTQLGLLHLRGDAAAGIPIDVIKGAGLLKKATERENVEANFHLGLLLRTGLGNLLPADPAQSLKHIIVSASHGHLGALLELASLTAKCEDSVNVYTRVLNAALLQPLAFRAHEFYHQALYDHAAVLYNLMASLGHETGQLNAAWLHERGLVATHLDAHDFADLMPINIPALSKSPHEVATLGSTLLQASIESLTSRLNSLADGEAYSVASSRTHRQPRSLEPEPEEDFLGLGGEETNLDEQEMERSLGDKASSVAAEQLNHAFELYKLASQQGSAEAALKIGDFYYYGTGIHRDYNRSVQFYHLAAGANHAQARYNLGFMYQYGLGVPQDFHLAQRYYDAAVAASGDAYVPTILAMAVLYFQSLLFGSFDPADMSWDNTLMALFVLALIIATAIRFRLR